MWTWGDYIKAMIALDVKRRGREGARTTPKFIRDQGAVLVVCPIHIDGRQYIRYLILGHIFIDDPTQKQIKSTWELFPRIKKVWVESPCPICQKIYNILPRFP